MGPSIKYVTLQGYEERELDERRRKGVSNNNNTKKPAKKSAENCVKRAQHNFWSDRRNFFCERDPALWQKKKITNLSHDLIIRNK